MKKLLCLLLSVSMLAAVGCAKPEPETSDVSETTVTEAQPTAPSAIHVDYSKLTPYEVPEEKYTFHEGYVAGKDLAARDDYGVLLPYYGKRDWVFDGTCGDWYQEGRELYGFVTDKGELVTDPIYYGVKITDDDKFLIAHRGNPDLGNPADASESKFIYLIAATDGSWAHVFPDCVNADYNAGILLTCHNDGTVRRWNEDGEEVQCFDIAATIDLDDLNPNLAPEERWWPLESGLVWSDAKVAHYSNSDGFDLDRYLIFETGEVRKTLPEGYSEEEERIEPSEPKQPEIENAWLRGHFIDPVTDALYFYGIVDEHNYYTLFDADGKVLIERFAKRPGKWGDYNEPLGIRAGLYATEEGGRLCYRSLADDSLVFCYIIQTNGD